MLNAELGRLWADSLSGWWSASRMQLWAKYSNASAGSPAKHAWPSCQSRICNALVLKMHSAGKSRLPWMVFSDAGQGPARIVQKL